MIFEKRSSWTLNVIFYFLYKFCLRKISHTKKNWTRYDKNVHWSLCKVLVILVRFQWNFYFLGRFSKNTQISNFIKILPVGTELPYAYRRTDGQTDMTKLTVAISQFCERSYKYIVRIILWWTLTEQQDVWNETGAGGSYGKVTESQQTQADYALGDRFYIPPLPIRLLCWIKPNLLEWFTSKLTQWKTNRIFRS